MLNYIQLQLLSLQVDIHYHHHRSSLPGLNLGHYLMNRFRTLLSSMTDLICPLVLQPVSLFSVYVGIWLGLPRAVVPCVGSQRINGFAPSSGCRTL